MEFFDKIRLDEWFYEADQNIKEQRFADAMQTLEAIVADSPNYAKAYNHLGWLYETKYRDLAKAEKMYRKCLELEPEYAPVYLNLAVVLSGMNNWTELKKILGKALQVPGVDKAAVYNEYAIMCELKCDYEKAIEYFKKAVRFTLKDANLDSYYNGIKRCRTKQEILSE